MTSLLVKALDRILVWIEQHKPWYLECLNPGLSKPEIDRLVRELPVQLPTEIYELYQWRNGARKGDLVRKTAWLFNAWTFYPLQEVIEWHQKWTGFCGSSWEIAKWIPSPIISFDLFYYPQGRNSGQVLFSDSLKNSPVLFLDIESGSIVERKYASLTQMMMTIAECYETGAYYNDPEFDPYFVNVKVEQEREIWRKHNSILLEDINKILNFMLQTREAYSYSFAEVVDEIIYFGNRTTIELLSQILKISIYQNNNYDISTMIFTKREVVKVLGKLSNLSAAAEAVPTLIASANKDIDLENKVCAAYLLAESRNEREFQPFVETLNSNQLEVKREARKSLRQLIEKFPELEDDIPF